MMTLHGAAELVSSIQAIARRYPVKKIVLFGSRARGDHKKTSDIDLAVFPEPEFHSGARFNSEVDDLETLLKVDLIVIDEQTGTELLERINKEGVMLYERSECETDKLQKGP